MAYTKTNWVSDQTPLSADNFNKIENGIKTVETEINSFLKVQSFNFTSKSVGANQDFSFETTVSDTGYVPIAVLSYNVNGSPWAGVAAVEIKDDNGTYKCSISGRNYGTTQITLAPIFKILFIKTDMYHREVVSA